MSSPDAAEYEVIVVGAGFGALAAIHHLRRRGVEDIVVLERHDGVGGTWRANTYPGAACDVPSHLYSLSFAPKPDWTRTYAGQPEILAYVEDCYDRLDARRLVRLGTTVTGLTWDDGAHRWEVSTAAGERLRGRAVIAATGMFHTPAIPSLPGIDDFAGPSFHSARWDHDIDLRHRRVAVIGTGASAVQVVPALADVVGHLDVHQRTPPWVLPRIDEAYDVAQREQFRREPLTARRLRHRIEQQFERATMIEEDGDTAGFLAEVARSHLEGSVADPGLRARLTPAYPLGCKRVLVSSDYYPTLQRDNVTLIDVGVAGLTRDGVVTTDGALHPCDAVVWCTGFRTTEYLGALRVTGRDGVDLHELWGGVPRAHLGMTIAGFPNLFLLYGPNTNQGGNSILLILEAQARYVADALARLAATGAATMEVRRAVMDDYVEGLREALRRSVWGSCDSYFRSETGEVVTQLPHTSTWYRRRTRRVDLEDFELGGEPAAASEPGSARS